MKSYAESFNERYGQVAPDGNKRFGKETNVSDIVQSIVGSLTVRGHTRLGMVAPSSVWRKMSDARLTAHTHNVVLRNEKVIRKLIVYMDSSVMMYEAAMNEPAIVAEWNALVGRMGLDMAVSSAEFKLSGIARKNGHNGSVVTTGSAEQWENPYERVELPVLTRDEIRKIDLIVNTIENQTLRLHTREAMIYSLRRKKTYQSDFGA